MAKMTCCELLNKESVSLEINLFVPGKFSEKGTGSLKSTRKRKEEID